MSAYILKACLALAAVLLVERRIFKKETRATRWLYLSLLGLSAAIWLYLGVDQEPVRPAVWLEQLLSPVALNNLQ
jgi:uncharacterized membrane protein